MKFNVELFGYLLMSVPVIQASRLLRSRNGISLNSTTLADTAQASNSTQENSIINGNCDAQTKLIANQAIDDAITMVQAVRGVWKEEQYRPVLQKYMGADCLDSTPAAWIDRTLSNIANLKIRWWWIVNAAGAALLSDWVYTYCGETDVLTFAGGYSPSCDSNSLTWSHTSKVAIFGQKGPGLKYLYYIGFCVSRMQANFVPLSTMLANAKSPLGLVNTTNEEQLAANYGGAALHGLVELAPLVSPWYLSGINQQQTWSMYSGSQQATTLASEVGCTGELRISDYNKLTINTLTNADSWAQWINALYFQIQLNMNSENFPQPGPPIPEPDLAVQSVNCQGKYTCQHFIKQTDCQAAIAKFGNDTDYAALTIRTAISHGQLNGCVATYVCDANVYPSYFSGPEIGQVFSKLYEPTLVGGCGSGAICGNVYLNNGCHVTLGSCNTGFCNDNSYEGVPATSPAELD